MTAKERAKEYWKDYDPIYWETIEGMIDEAVEEERKMNRRDIRDIMETEVDCGNHPEFMRGFNYGLLRLDELLRSIDKGEKHD